MNFGGNSDSDQTEIKLFVYEQVRVKSTEWKRNKLIDGHYTYLIETKLKDKQEIYEVRRRYTEFVYLNNLLKMESPACIIPPLPPKTSMVKIKGAESDVVENRKRGIDTFLASLVQHARLQHSDVLKVFLTSTATFSFEEHLAVVQGEYPRDYLLTFEQGQIFTDEKAIGDNTSVAGGVISFYQNTAKKFSDLVWGDQDFQKKEAFGEYVTMAEEELSFFKREEEYIVSLMGAFESLK